VPRPTRVATPARLADARRASARLADARRAAQALQAADALRAALLAWFAAHGRTLPEREAREPWRVLVSEVMSQQTQIARSLQAAATFCAHFPTPQSLAEASPAEAVRAWAGLGYNRRALALRAAAQAIVERHASRIPADPAALLDLPGIGPYTARAIAARAYGLPVMPVDVNVRRVLGRLLGAADAATVQALGDAIAGSAARNGPARAEPTAHPGEIADALMDLAALVCRPRRPDCPACPFEPHCAQAASAGQLVGGAAGGAPDRRPRPERPRSTPPTPFPRSRRWLRGQLLRELRLAPPGAWLAIEGDRGMHGHTAVREALGALAAEGFVELDQAGRARLAEG
jgi:A/G-specific adenine glycosylase